MALRRRGKIILALFALPPVLAVALMVFGLPLDSCRDALARELGQLTGTVCSIGKIKLSFSELRAENAAFTLARTPGEKPFCTVGTVRAALDWELVKALYHGNGIDLREFAADSIFFDLDALQNALKKPVAAAPETARADPTAGATRQDAPGKTPGLKVAKLSVRDMRFVMHGVEMKIDRVDGRRSPEGAEFTAAGSIGTGKLSCQGSLQMLAEHSLLDAKQIESSFKLDGLSLRVFYQLFPSSFDFLREQGKADGDLDISYNWGNDEISFSGSVKTRDVIAFLFDEYVPVPESVWDFAGSYANEKMLIDKFALTGEVDDFHMDGYADFVKGTQVFKVSSAHLSVPLVCKVAGNQYLARLMKGMVYFDGFVSADHDDLEIKVNGGSHELEPQLPPLNLTKKVSGKCDFLYRSRDRILRLDNLTCAYDFGKAEGFLQFPWVKKQWRADDFACDMTVESELAPLSRLVGLKLGGRVLGKVSLTNNGTEEINFKTELRGLQEVDAEFSTGEKLDLGKFNFTAAGSSRWGKQEHRFDRIVIDTRPLQGVLSGAHRGGKSELDYRIRVEPRLLWPFWVHALKGNVNAAVFGTIDLWGKASLDEALTLTLPQAHCRGQLLRGENQSPWHYSFTGDARAETAGARAFTLRNGRLQLHDGGQALLNSALTADSVKRPDDGSSPRLVVTTQLQSRLPHLRELHRLLQLPVTFPPLDGGALAANARVTISDTAPTAYQIGINLAEARSGTMMQKQQMAFQAVLEDRSRVDGSVNFHNCRLRTADRALDVSGEGRIFSLENPQVAFDLTAHNNLEKTLQALNIKPPFKLSGMVDSRIKIAGAANRPEFTVDGRAVDIVIDDGERLRKLLQPEFSGKFSFTFDRRTGDISGVEIPRGVLRTADWQLQVSARADRLHYRPSGAPGMAPALDFGKGMACNYQLDGKRNFLPWLLPELAALADGAPDTPESLRSRGTLRARELPLTTAGPGDYRWLRQMQIENGHADLDCLRAGKILLRNLSAPYTLNGGILQVENGHGECGGTFAFSAREDFTGDTPTGYAELLAAGLDLAQVLGKVAESTEITAGQAFIPADPKGAPLRAAWRGASLPEVLDSLQIPAFTLRAENVTVKTVQQPIDWEKMLQYDFHQSVAKEIARYLGEMSRENAGKPQTLHLKDISLAGALAKRCLTLNPVLATGADTADIRGVGRVFFDRRLQLRLWPSDHLERHFDMQAMAKAPAIKRFLDSLPADRQQEALRLVPDWLNRLARQNKLFLDINGTADAPEFDMRGLRDGLKAALPELTNKFAELLGQSKIIHDIFGKDAFKDAGKGGKPLIDLDKLLD